MREKDLITRFWNKVNKNGPIIKSELGPCWIWYAHTDDDGYGVFWYQNKNRRAHRVSLYFEGILIPDDLLVLHKCDNPPCVRHDHLFVGSNEENMRDMTEKKRSAPQHGEFNPQSKLKEKDVIEMKRLYKIGFSQDDIAIEFNVARTCVSRVINGKRWSHLYLVETI